jgi:hypothetical protein
VQISILRLRRAVLTVAARREPTPEEMELVRHLATLSETERRQLIDDLLDTVFDSPLDHAAIRRTMTPVVAAPVGNRERSAQGPVLPTAGADQRLAGSGTPGTGDQLVREALRLRVAA